MAIIEQCDQLVRKPFQLIAGYIELHKITKAVPRDRETSEAVVAKAKDF